MSEVNLLVDQDYLQFPLVKKKSLGEVFCHPEVGQGGNISKIKWMHATHDHQFY